MAISTRTPHAGSDWETSLARCACRISTRTPHAGSDVAPAVGLLDDSRFQPALPMRGVTVTLVMAGAVGVFQPALPMRGVTCSRRRSSRSSIFQPALPMRGVTPYRLVPRPCRDISTRTPHAGSDLLEPCVLGVPRISTRTPHAGSDRNIMRKIYCLDQHIAPIDKQGTRNKRVRHLYVTLFGANLTYVICELRARTMVLQCQEPFSFVRWLRTYMLNLRLIFASKTVESQTIFLRIDQLDELALDTNHRRSIGNAFEH